MVNHACPIWYVSVNSPPNQSDLFFEIRFITFSLRFRTTVDPLRFRFSLFFLMNFINFEF